MFILPHYSSISFRLTFQAIDIRSQSLLQKMPSYKLSNALVYLWVLEWSGWVWPCSTIVNIAAKRIALAGYAWSRVPLPTDSVPIEVCLSTVKIDAIRLNTHLIKSRICRMRRLKPRHVKPDTGVSPLSINSEFLPLLKWLAYTSHGWSNSLRSVYSVGYIFY